MEWYRTGVKDATGSQDWVSLALELSVFVYGEQNNKL